MFSLLTFSTLAAAAPALVYVSNAELSITEDYSGIVITGDVDAADCDGCSIAVVHDFPKLSDVGFVGEGIITADGVALLTDGLKALHIGQTGSYAGTLSADEDFDKFLDSPTCDGMPVVFDAADDKSFDKFLDSPTCDGMPVVWFVSEKGDLITLADDISDEVGMAACSMRGSIELADDDTLKVEASWLSVGALHKDELVLLDPLELVFDSPIDPAILEKAIVAAQQ